MIENQIGIKAAVTALLAPAVSFCAPVMPLIYVCTAMVIADSVSAWRLSRRLKQVYPGNSELGKFSSRKFGRVFVALGKIYLLLLLSHSVDAAIFGGLPLFMGLSLTRMTAAAVVLWQGLSILENEATSSDNRWAGKLRRFLIDKASRHLGGDGS